MMQSEDQYKDKPDDFSRKVGEKLRNQRMAVDPAVWDALSDKLPPRGRTVPYHWLWAAAGIAAAVGLLLFLLPPSTDEPLLTEHTPTGEPRKQERVAQSKNKNEYDPIGEQWEQEGVVPSVPADEPEGETGNEAEGEAGVEPPLNPIAEESVAQLPEAAKPENVSDPKGTGKPEEAAKPEGVEKPEGVGKQDKTGGPGKGLITETPSYADVPLQPGIKEISAEEGAAENDALRSSVRKQRIPRSFMAALGSGDALDLSFGGLYDAGDASYNDYFPGTEPDIGAGPGTGDDYHILTPPDYTDVAHRLPVTFSLTADFPIGEKVSLETGLSYTYLFSRMSRNDQFTYRGTLRQHYLGIPVNLRYTVWHNEAWNIYLLGGGSIEKGILSVYKQEIERDGNVVYHTDVYSRIDGFQLSLQGGAGFSYRLHRNLHLFGEPRIVYYFRNNQPMSARTENPRIFGLNMGVRIQFK